MKKKLAAAALAMAVGLAMVGTVPVSAGWLDVVAALGGGSSTSARSSSASSARTASTRAGRWAKVYSTDNYVIYIDTKTMKAEGQAQNRFVTGYFKREYTPIGSQWLGNNSDGRVKPDVITHSIYHGGYGVNGCDYAVPWKYYDVNNHLIYEGRLGDYYDELKEGRYTPDSPNEQIRDILFRAVGWDY